MLADTNGSGPTAVAESAVAASTPGIESPAVSRPLETRTRLSRRQGFRLAGLSVLLVLLGAAAGAGVAALTPPVYAAQADVLYLLTREQATGFLREDRNLTTQLVIIESRSVLQPVADEWDRPVAEVGAALEATVLEESEVIHLRFVDADPDRAQKMLDAIIRRYLVVSNNDERAELRNYLDGELRVVLTRIDEVRTVGPLRAAELAPLVDREQWLRSQLDEVRLSDFAGPDARVLVDPYVEPGTTGLRPLVAAGAGALAALIVAILAVAVLGRRFLLRQQWRGRQLTRP